LLTKKTDAYVTKKIDMKTKPLLQNFLAYQVGRFFHIFRNPSVSQTIYMMFRFIPKNWSAQSILVTSPSQLTSTLVSFT
jgi:hypothetical protein